MSDYHVRIETGELRAESSRPFRSETAPAVFDRNVLTEFPADCAQGLLERRNVNLWLRLRLNAVKQHADPLELVA
jgi:hypothetical protein